MEKHKSLFLVFIFLLWVQLFPLSENESTQKLKDTLKQMRKLHDENRLIDALELSYKEFNNPNLFCNRDFDLQESFVWEAAMLNLEYANSLSNDQQREAYCQRALLIWKKYINWYDGLSDSDRQKLFFSRINMAVCHLGNTIILGCDPHDLFTENEDIPPGYFGKDAIDLWKNWLYACPSKRPIESSERTAAVRRQLICNNEDCGEHWHEYAIILHDWAEKARLNSATRTTKLRESEQILKEYKKCWEGR